MLPSELGSLREKPRGGELPLFDSCKRKNSKKHKLRTQEQFSLSFFIVGVIGRIATTLTGYWVKNSRVGRSEFTSPPPRHDARHRDHPVIEEIRRLPRAVHHSIPEIASARNQVR